jgi:hypothetical protein
MVAQRVALAAERENPLRASLSLPNRNGRSRGGRADIA